MIRRWIIGLYVTALFEHHRFELDVGANVARATMAKMRWRYGPLS